jgi:hypothetical protein
MAEASILGDSVTIGCTLPGGINGSKVYSIDKQNASGSDIDFTPNLGPGANQGIGEPCQKVLNLLTPKVESTTIFGRIILNCGSRGGIANGAKFGVWQAAGQAAANPFFPNPTVAGALFAAQSAPPGPAQPVLLAPPNATSDYALVSYTFVCALDVGNLSLFAINATQTP